MQKNIRQIIVNEAMTWLKTPWHHQANIKNVGVDCCQLIIEVYKSCNLLTQDFNVQNYAKDWHLHRTEQMFLFYVYQHCIKVDKALKGDIALFSFGRTISHGGIMINDNEVIHAFIDVKQVCISDLSTNIDLKNRLHGFYRLKQLEAENT